MPSQWDRDSDMISWIQFRSGWSRKKRNKEISKIERRMEKQEALELEPNTPRNRTGYYCDPKMKDCEEW